MSKLQQYCAFQSWQRIHFCGYVENSFLFRLYWHHLFSTYPAQSSQQPVRIFYLVSAGFESAPKLYNPCTPLLEVHFTFPFSIKCLCEKTTSASLVFVHTLKRDRTSLTAATGWLTSYLPSGHLMCPCRTEEEYRFAAFLMSKKWVLLRAGYCAFSDSKETTDLPFEIKC